MKLTKLGSLALAGSLVFVSACSDDDPPAATGDTLTVAEFQQMGSAFSGIGTVAFRALLDGLDAGRPGGIAAQGALNFNITRDCPAGGSTNVTGSAVATGQNSIGLSVTQTMNNCAVLSDAEEVWVFNTDPSLRWSATGTENGEGDFTLTSTWSGRFDWSSVDAEKEGGCAVSVQLSASGNRIAGNFTATLTGSVCGVAFEESFSYNPA